ncbi:MAG TPA: hypothetical protein VIX37_21355 [Candidatus Sulfotelmatobacter sp.]
MTITKHAALLLMTLVGLTALLNAQTSTTLKTPVPFEFVANGKTMPAGECTIAVVVNGQTLLSISSGKQHAYAFPISDESPNARKYTALVFHQYGDRYVLTGIKREKGIGYQLPASRLERELQARNIPWQVFTLLASAK